MRSFVLALALCLTGCPVSHELLVELHSDLVPGVEFDTIELRLDGAVNEEPVRASDYLRGVRLMPLSIEDGPHEIRAALRRGSTEVLSRRFVGTFHGPSLLALWLVRSCVGLVCEPLTCDGGRCVEDTCDGGPGCTSPACMVDADCGATTVACAENRCDDGRCVWTPIDGACGVGASCDAVAGCVGGPVDAGVVDAGAGDGGCSCDDGNACTDDVCDGTGRCTHSVHTAACDDGDACTHDDRCASGTCAGTSYTCTPPPCGSASCDGAGGCTTSGGCGGGTVCVGGGCQACGGADQPCCDAGGCNTGLWCFESVCSCGQAGGPCCPWDGSCAVGTCAGGSCPTCYAYGTACDGRLGCCMGVCRSGLCLD